MFPKYGTLILTRRFLPAPRPNDAILRRNRTRDTIEGLQAGSYRFRLAGWAGGSLPDSDSCLLAPAASFRLQKRVARLSNPSTFYRR
jgi:hypothetical protein